jgi:transposase InsO family protein
LADWSEDNNLKINFVEPGKPTQKSHIGRFNRTYRDDLVDPYLFRTLGEVRTMTEEWRSRYNAEITQPLKKSIAAAAIQSKNAFGQFGFLFNAPIRLKY